MCLIFCEWIAGFEGQPDGHIRERLQLLGLRQALVQKPSFFLSFVYFQKGSRARADAYYWIEKSETWNVWSRKIPRLGRRVVMCLGRRAPWLIGTREAEPSRRARSAVPPSKSEWGTIIGEKNRSCDSHIERLALENSRITELEGGGDRGDFSRLVVSASD